MFNTRTRKVKDGKIFTIYIDKPHLEHLKRIAHKMSLSEGRDVSTSEAIRMALEVVYPMSKQLDLFESDRQKKKRESFERLQMNFSDLCNKE